MGVDSGPVAVLLERIVEPFASGHGHFESGMGHVVERCDDSLACRVYEETTGGQSVGRV